MLNSLKSLLFAGILFSSLNLSAANTHAFDIVMLRSATKLALYDAVDATGASRTASNFWYSYASYFPQASHSGYCYGAAADCQMVSVHLLNEMIHMIDMGNPYDSALQQRLFELATVARNYSNVSGSYANYGRTLAPFRLPTDDRAVSLQRDAHVSIELLVEILNGGNISAGPQPEPPGDPLRN